MSETWQGPVDLDNCAREPIHVPGAIQRHGFLLALREPSLTVAYASANLDEWLGVEADAAIGSPLAGLLGDEGAAAIDLARGGSWLRRHDAVRLEAKGHRFAAVLHRSGGHLIAELEVERTIEADEAASVRECAMALQAAPTVLEVADEAARRIRSLTGFDRVMVYRFDAEWNGEVIAEHKRDDLNSFLGLHYPSTDIPAQARELYRTNWLRLIPDIRYQPVPIVPYAAHDSEEPLDLSMSVLRSVSPIHIEYLSNMGVSASMSVSIIVRGELWGLVACHHYSGPHDPGAAVRNATEYLGQLVSLRVTETVEADQRAMAFRLGSIADRVAEALADATHFTLDDVLAEREDAVLALAGAAGAVIGSNGRRLRVGRTPPDHVIDAVLDSWADDEEVLVTDQLVERCPAVAPHLDVASGVLGVALTTDRREHVLWFRPELVRLVDWGGDPLNAKLAAEEGRDVRLSPRKSFDRWRQAVRERSNPWLPSEIQAADRFARHLARTLLRSERDARVLADDLQRVMLPSDLPKVEGWGLDAYYSPAGVGLVGGDWYDAFALDDNRIAAVIGDVAGHGLKAAAEMAQIRNYLRAYLYDDGDPAAALARLDRFMIRVMPGSVVTVVCAVLDTATATLTVSHAGHPPCLLVRGDRAEHLEGSQNRALGVLEVRRTNQQVELAPGDGIVLYSDGLVESRALGIDAGLDLLRDRVPAVFERPGAVGVAAGLAESMSEVASGDDVTVVALWRE